MPPKGATFRGWTKQDPLREMSDIERAWLAAVIDGEGCIQYHPHKFRTPKLVIVNCSLPFLEQVREIVGLGNITRHRRGDERTSEAWRYALVGIRAVECLIEVLPYLIIKRDKAVYVITERIIEEVPSGN